MEELQRAVTWARELEPEISCLVVSGGVASNQVVRARLAEVAEQAGLPLICPPPSLCTDNGVMVAWTGVERLRLGLTEAPPTEEQAALEATGEVDVSLKPRWLLGERHPMAVQLGSAKGMKTKRIHPALTGLCTPKELSSPS
ncbi:glutamated carboxypeptidase [Cymbomonas tetramitiformis]|uniref:Glutamated carboxypeptidase n=1 Tax=Cymbomonas tetramitiformis TaxID=36881 RepID=A0AAE0EV29_9CHLO|nr:glutamated carboxypeptidase [Cymbomonas tetramitiformis]